jgi:peptidyl-prolyl cis-trans isomerase SurA
MQRGEISDPIHSPSGYHIILVEDFKGGERHMVKQTHARQILVVTNEITSDSEARTRLEQLKTRIDGGDDFAALAQSNSDDRSSAIEGGDLGWLTPGDLLPEFEKQMDSLEIDEVSEPFRTEFGWHIVQVIDRREYDSTEEVQKAEARNAIRKRKFNEETELYLRRLRDEAYVVIRLNQIN